MVFCDSMGIAVDAIRASVPVAFIGQIENDKIALQDCVTAFIVHGDKHRLVADQNDILNIRLKQSRDCCYVLTHQNSLNTLVQRVVTNAIKQDNFLPESTTTDNKAELENVELKARKNAPDSIILSSQLTFTQAVTNLNKVKVRIEATYRKLHKFRESPTRFLADSKHPVLRSLATRRSH